MKNMNCSSDFEVCENEPLKKHSTFRIGGMAKYAIFPLGVNDFIAAINFAKCRNLKFCVIGKGSNVLFDDSGYDGVVIFTGKMTASDYEHTENGYDISVSCGRLLTDFSVEVGRKFILSGMEFAYGIPGTVGGAVYMNAGAYGSQMSDVVSRCDYFDCDSGKICTASAQELEFSYRKSLFSENKNYIVLSATFSLKFGDKKVIAEKMRANMQSRRDKQPLEYPSAGSTFKRPGENVFAGKLIEDAGLKGFSIGGAQVSEKHAGFIINTGDATAEDVKAVIDHVKNVVYENSGIMLEREVIYIS